MSYLNGIFETISILVYGERSSWFHSLCVHPLASFASHQKEKIKAKFVENSIFFFKNFVVCLFVWMHKMKIQITWCVKDWVCGYARAKRAFRQIMFSPVIVLLSLGPIQSALYLLLRITDVCQALVFCRFSFLSLIATCCWQTFSPSVHIVRWNVCACLCVYWWICVWTHSTWHFVKWLPPHTFIYTNAPRRF